MTATITATNAQHIAADTYVGKWTALDPRRSDVFQAHELATPGQLIVVWEFSGHTRGGRSLYVRTRFVGQTDGSLAGYDSTGRHIITHPAGRELRVITK